MRLWELIRLAQGNTVSKQGLNPGLSASKACDHFTIYVALNDPNGPTSFQIPVHSDTFRTILEKHQFPRFYLVHKIQVSCVLSISGIGLPGGSEVKNPSTNEGDPDSIPGSGRSPGEGNGNPLQYSCLGNPMDRGAWSTTVYGVTEESDTAQ